MLFLYLLILLPLGIMGLHRAWMVQAVLRQARRHPPPAPDTWPVVTVQLPLFNERHVAARVVAAAGALDYPRDRLHVQVLDDSTDDTTAIAQTAVDALVDSGVDAVLLHRDLRPGFKAGALEAGLQAAKGELVAVFDADFRPQPDVLKRLVPWFAKPDVGMVQARWGHLNADESWLTRTQATLLDGHFCVEHAARHATGRWFNFNGTAGMWRRAAIEQAGGWQHDTLTEDLDLSYRAQLVGWRFEYLDDVVVPAELPSTVAAFKQQQARWARGSVQTARKLLGPIWRSDAPLVVKLDAMAHLTANAAYPLMLLLAVLLPIAVAARGMGGPLWLTAVDVLVFVAAFASMVAFYAVAVARAGGPRGGRWARIPTVLGVGLGLSVNQTMAVVAGLFGPVGVFERTPKRGSARVGLYDIALPGSLAGELVLAVWLWGALVVAMLNGLWASTPFLLLFAAGYAAMVLPSVHVGRRRRKPDVLAGAAVPAATGSGADRSVV